MSIQESSHRRNSQFSIKSTHEIFDDNNNSFEGQSIKNDLNSTAKYQKFNLWKFIKSMKIEPVAFCLSFVAMSRFLAMQQMIQDKLCIKQFNQTFDYCRSLSGEENTVMKDDILAATSTYTFYYTTIMVIPGLFWCIFVGSWCDKYLGARKLFIILCAVSGFVEAIFLILNAYFFQIGM